MSDYSNTFGGAAKDSNDDVILGSDFDTQFDAVATMSATKANKTGAPATTNNLAMLTSTGDLADSLIETDGSGNFSGNIVGNLTGNVTGNITGDVTTDVITAETTNGDLELTRNGTGGISVDGTVVSFPVLLTSAEGFYSVSTITDATWVTIDTSSYSSGTYPNTNALGTNGATHAVIRMYIEETQTLGGFGSVIAHARATGSGAAADSTTVVLGAKEYDSGSNIGYQAVSEFTVPLDSNGDFDIFVNYAVDIDAITMALVGYYF